MIEKIEICNQRWWHINLSNLKQKGVITLTTHNKKGELLQDEEIHVITEGDFVMMVNWWYFQKTQGNKNLMF